MSLWIDAPAKVNLTLEVLGKRDDGYHEIVSVLQTISLADTLSFEIGNTLELHCDVPGLQSADNLALRAARLLGQATGCEKGASIYLTKRIPVAAGLGSGATDAAAALVGLDRLWGTNLPFQRLLGLAAELGSDVAFFLYGGTALAKGRGEQVTPLPSVTEMWMVLLIPPIEIADKTAQMYSQLNAGHFTSGRLTERLVDTISRGERIDASLLYNVFEQVAFDFYYKLTDNSAHFTAAGAASVNLAGAGPALFTLVSGEAEGEAVLRKLKSDGQEACLVRTVQSEPPASGGDITC